MSIIWRAPDTGLEPEFKADVDRLLGNSRYIWYVQMAYRTMAEQAGLYARYQQGGPKAAPPGKSAHNFGLAVDVVLDVDPGQGGLQPSWDTHQPGWVWLFEALEVHPRLYSGVHFGDGGHIEKKSWTQYKDWASRPK